MGLDRTKHQGMSISQYCPPLCFELAGKDFDLAMDDGYTTLLRFEDEKTVSWSIAGSAPKTEQYQCLKGDDHTYLVNYELEGVENREDHTFVLDLENSLVTRIIARVGENPEYPYLINTHVEFGALRREGQELPFKRHGFTSDVIGTGVQWTYGCELATVHIYYCANFYRITYPADHVVTEEAKQQNEGFNTLMKKVPSSDEPTNYIKIKDNMYLFSLIEQNMEKVTGGGAMGFRSNTLCFLQNYNRMYQVGRGWGATTGKDGVDRPINIMIGAYGRFIEKDDEFFKHFFTDPNPYLV